MVTGAQSEMRTTSRFLIVCLIIFLPDASRYLSSIQNDTGRIFLFHILLSSLTQAATMAAQRPNDNNFYYFSHIEESRETKFL